MNRLHVMTAIQRCALDGATDPDEIYGKIRKALPGAVNNGADEIMTRAECQAFAKQAIHQASVAHFPVEKARLALDITEGELRADLLDAIAKLDISNPRDCRDVFELHQKVGGSTGEPTLMEAIHFLGDADQNVDSLMERALQLFPPQKMDDE